MSNPLPPAFSLTACVAVLVEVSVGPRSLSPPSRPVSGSSKVAERVGEANACEVLVSSAANAVSVNSGAVLVSAVASAVRVCCGPKRVGVKVIVAVRVGADVGVVPALPVEVGVRVAVFVGPATLVCVCVAVGPLGTVDVAVIVAV